MKRFNLYIAFAAIVLLGTACSGDWLDLDSPTSVDSNDAITSLTDAENALNGIYRLASAHSYYGDNYWYYGDCRATDVQARVTKGDGKRVSPYYEYNVQATDNLNCTLPWNAVYKVIRQANNLIQKIDGGSVQTSDTESLGRIRAEALAMRGLSLFNLTRFFGMPYTNDEGASLGVPIETVPNDANHHPARNTVAECYAQVVKDLTDALPGLTKEKSDGYLNYWAAQALLSRIYLNMGDEEDAYKAAIDVIDNNGGLYQLYTRAEYASVWGKDFPSESLFELYISLTEPSGGTGGEGAPMVYANESTVDWNNLILTEAYLDLLDEDADDVRHELTQASVIANNTALPEAARDRNVFLAKFPGKDGSDPRTNDICIIRLSEVYLNAAEAGVKLGGSYVERARTLFNTLVDCRTTNTAMQASSSDFTLDRVLKERRKELVGEGEVYYDYLRNGLTIRRSGGWHLSTLEASDAESIAPTDSRVVVPIPQSEIDANPNI